MNYDNHEIITSLTYDKSDIFLRTLFEIQQRPFVIKSQIKNTSNYVILCPTVVEDYDALRQISLDYGTWCKINKKQQFLNRFYNSRSYFNDKLTLLNKIWQSHNILNPLCYQERINQTRDPCFETSLLFTIFVPKLNKNKAVGDIWLSHVELCDIDLYKGAIERSTLIDYKFQNKGIGQTAVKALYRLVLEEWFDKPITLINSKNELEQSNYIFTGVYSFVDYRNFRSLGNNVKSGNYIMGVSILEQNMIIFRAVNKNSLQYNLLLSIDIGNMKQIVDGLININAILEYNNAILEYNNFKLLNNI